MSLRSASLAQIIENSFIFEIRSPGLARCYLTTNASPARSFCVARITQLSTRSADLNNLGHVLANLRFSRFPLRLRRGFFPCARPLLSNAPFARSRFGFWLFRRGPLPLSRCFAFLTQLLLVQIPSELLISKTAAKAGSSNCQCSCDLNWPAARCHVPRTLV